MAIGKNNDAPAIYSTVSSIKRLLDHLKEAAFYSSKDLEAMSKELQKHHTTLQRCQAEYDPELIELIERRIAVCEDTISYLQSVINHLTPELAEDWEKLVSILRRLSNLNTRSRYSPEEHAGLKKEIAELATACPCLRKELPESITQRYNEIMSDSHDALNQPPEKLVMDLYERCVLWSSIIEKKPLYVDPDFKDLYKRLKSIRDSLESRSLLQAWSLRETDLYDFQRQLDRIDGERTPDGNFMDSQGKRACLQTQRTLLYFLRKGYALIYLMLTHSEPVSEALLPIYNQLKTLKKCLQEVKKAGGVSSPRELYPYSMKVCLLTSSLYPSSINILYRLKMHSSTPSTTCKWTANSWSTATSPTAKQQSFPCCTTATSSRTSSRSKPRRTKPLKTRLPATCPWCQLYPAQHNLSYPHPKLGLRMERHSCL
jgi:predicted  nucleic acid-binding Zn-ribbon protein